jgi:hypothetical protein
MKTENAIKMDIIQAYIRPNLKPLGYKSRRRAFNKRLDNGLIQVINLQMAPSTSFLYGKFTVELGVFIPEVYKFYFTDLPIPSFIQTGHCQFTSNRLGNISQLQYDKWWELRNDSYLIATEVWDLLQQYGLPYLNRLATREAILSEWKKIKQQFGYWRLLLPMTIVLVAMGEMGKAEEILQREKESYRDDKRFVEELCSKLGINIPLEEV